MLVRFRDGEEREFKIGPWANLDGANLVGANLSWAYLRGASLKGANLWGTSFFSANLKNTVLDPDNEPNAIVDGFEQDGDYVYGYRTRKAGHIDKYCDGRIYSADVFSTCDTECHPGLYLWPTLEMSKEWSSSAEHIKVRTKAADVHKAGSKWRCMGFEVVGKAE